MFSDGVYRVYNVTLGADKQWTYRSAMRFQIQAGNLTILEDSTGALSRYVQNGPITQEQERHLKALSDGSYRHVLIEQPGQMYPAEFKCPA